MNPTFLSYLRLRSLGRLRSGIGQHSLGLIPSSIDFSYLRGASLHLGTTTYPGSYDLRALGKLSPIEDQDPYGACWAFATMGSLESCLLPTDPESFSEDNLALNSGFDSSFDHSTDTADSYSSYMYGGSALMATAYLARWAGPVAAGQDAYGDGSTPPGLVADEHVQEALYLPARMGPTDNDAIKWAITNYGAVYTSIYADSGMSSSTSSAAFNPATNAYCYSGSAVADHAVDIVGWNDTYSRSNFSTTPPGNGAFIVRNSWGTNWGDGGYFYISYYDDCIGYDSNAVFDDAEPTSNFSGIYQYDPLGWTSSIGYSSATAWFANDFTADADDPLTAVSFYAAKPGSSYALFVSVGGSSPMTAAGSGTLAMAGYHTVTLSSPMPLTSGQDFVVAVHLTTPGYDYPIPLETNIAGFSSGATSAFGESFISSDGNSWTDLTGDDGHEDDNVCLKAFTGSSNSGDTFPPTTTVFPANQDEVGYWNNAPCTFTFSAEENAGGSGVARTETDLDNGGWLTWSPGTVFTVPAPADHSGDGNHTFLVRSTDVAGNAESPQTFSLAIDTRRPSSQARSAARVRRGSYATLKFKVVDAQPCFGSCQAVITVKTLKGQRKLTLSPKPWYKSGRFVSYRFRCKLPRGKYRFFVTAWDGAANRSARAAWNYLTVN